MCSGLRTHVQVVSSLALRKLRPRSSPSQGIPHIGEQLGKGNVKVVVFLAHQSEQHAACAGVDGWRCRLRTRQSEDVAARA
jgi:hypothetical protein